MCSAMASGGFQWQSPGAVLYEVGEDMADAAAPPVYNPNAGSYTIRLLETNYNIQKEIVVDGEMSVGQVTLRLVDEIGKN